MMLEPRLVRLLRELTEAPAPSGAEGPVRRILMKEMEPLCDDIASDRLGSIIGRKRGESETPSIMVAAHMDEVGFMVTEITEAGFIRFQTLGGWWSQVLLAQQVTIIAADGTPVPGVIGSKPPHLLSPDEMKQVVKTEDMFIDIGATSASDVQSFGVSPGCPIVPRTPFTPMRNPNHLMAKAWDDRAGCAILVEVLRRLEQEGHPNTVSAVATVQEEVGLRGATTSVDVSDPDVAIVVDVTIPTDTPGLESSKKTKVKLGKGPVLTLYDASMIPHRPLLNLVKETAERLGVAYQFEVMSGGGTDAGKIHVFREGVPSIVIGLGARYIHSHASVLSAADLMGAVQLVAGVIQRLDKKTVQGLVNVDFDPAPQSRPHLDVPRVNGVDYSPHYSG